MRKRYVVRLSSEERTGLEEIIHRGRQAAHRRRHAQVLLLADEAEGSPGLTDRRVAEQVGCSVRLVEMIRERCVQEGLQASLERRPRSRERSQVLDGAKEARLVSLACSEPPAGRARWTLDLLGQQLVTLGVVPSISPETVRKVLKKHTQTLAEAHVVHSRDGQRSVCLSDGGGSGRLPSAP